MARYDVTVLKEVAEGPLAGRRWRNVYKIEAPDYDTALAVGDVIAGHEMQMSSSIVTVPEVVAHLRDGSTPPRTPGKTFASGRQGELDPAGDLLPLFNCVRVDFTDSVIGRPERKYYRPPLYTSQVSGLVLDIDYFNLVQTSSGSIAALDNYVGPSGESHQGVIVQSLVQMRQEHWHRRQRPGFLRGYVPVAP